MHIFVLAMIAVAGERFSEAITLLERAIVLDGEATGISCAPGPLPGHVEPPPEAREAARRG